MSGFKLIAIRLLEGTDENYKKNLVFDKFFSFYNDFTLKKIENGILLTDKSSGIDLFSIQRKGNIPLNINLSAIVGKNGSGKSAIFDLIYLTSFLLIKKFNIPIEPPIIKGMINLKKSPNTLILGILKKINYEIIFKEKDNFWLLKINSSGIMFYPFNESDSRIFKCDFSKKVKNESNKTHTTKKPDKFSLVQYFYSIAINYSIYGLYGPEKSWLDQLFHKNDGYQTPLVINPYRYYGNINVNNEYELAQARILTNIEHFETDEILEGKRINEIEFEFDPLKLTKLIDTPFSKCIQATMDISGVKEIFSKLIMGIFNNITSHENVEMFFETDPPYYLIFEENYLLEDKPNIPAIKTYKDIIPYLLKYIVYKVFKLVIRDIDLRVKYGSEFHYNQRNTIYCLNIDSDEKLNELIQDISLSNSHLTFKIRQTIYLLKNKSFLGWDMKNYGSYISFKTNYESFSANLVAWKLESIGLNYKDIDLIPGSFSKIRIGIKHVNSTTENGEFQKMSSGEQQLILTLQTIYYHLQNLNSVEETLKKVRYRNINIMLDEIELYFHPEYQRQFIYNLLDGIERLKIPKIESINIIFSTHSPFILSDLPKSNVLKLVKGKPTIKKLTETFGANIHRLLADDFFMSEGFMGEFAKKKIQRVLDNLRNEQVYENQKMEPNEMWQIIELIGEPFLKEKLGSMYIAKYGDPESINIKLQKAKAEVERLTNLSNKES